MKYKNYTLEDILYYLGLLLLFIGIIYAILPMHPDMECFWRKTTGIFCPGCGGTRAVRAILNGDFWSSFLYHPAVPIGIIIYIGFMISQTFARITHFKYFKGMQFRLWIPISVLILAILNFVVKNVLWFLWQIEIL